MKTCPECETIHLDDSWIVCSVCGYDSRLEEYV